MTEQKIQSRSHKSENHAYGRKYWICPKNCFDLACLRQALQRLSDCEMGYHVNNCGHIEWYGYTINNNLYLLANR